MSRDHYNILKIYPSPIRFFLCVDAVTTAPTCCYRDINYLTSLFWSELGDIFSLKYTAKWKTVGQRSNHTHNLNHKSINNWKETSFSISLGYRYCFLIFITFTSFLFLFLLYQLPPSLFSLFFFPPRTPRHSFLGSIFETVSFYNHSLWFKSNNILWLMVAFVIKLII